VTFSRHIRNAAPAAIIVALAAVLAGRFFLNSPNFLSYALAGTFVLHMWTRPSRREILATFGLAAIFVLWHSEFRGSKDLLAGGLMTPGHFLGLASLVVLGAPIPWSTGDRCRKRIMAFEVAAALPLFVILSAVTLPLTAEFHPRTYDLTLYAFDGALGFQPSFLVGQLFARFAWLRGVSHTFYAALPVAVAILYATLRDSPQDRGRPNILFIFGAAGVAGYLLYHFVPAAGPIYLFSAEFPFSPPSVSRLSVGPVLLNATCARWPRNAMPSLHLAWALLLWWNSRQSPRWVRVLAGFFLGFAFLATLGLGEHYLIDLVVGVPFALAVQAAFTAGARVLPLLAGAATTLLWLGLFRLGAPDSLTLARMYWALALVNVLWSLLLERSLRGVSAHRVAAAEN